MAVVATALGLSACGDGQSSHPFVGKWERDKAQAQSSCIFSRANITRAHINLPPLGTLTITDIKGEKSQWVLNVTGGDGTPVVLKDVTPQSLKLTSLTGLFTCKMKKVGECTNVLCD